MSRYILTDADLNTPAKRLAINYPVCALDLDPLIITILLTVGLTSMWRMLEKSREEMLKIQNLGPRRLAAVRAACLSHLKPFGIEYLWEEDSTDQYVIFRIQADWLLNWVR